MRRPSRTNSIKDGGLRVKLTRSLHFFDEEEKRDVFIPAGTDGRAYRARQEFVTVLFSRALVGPADRAPHAPSTIEVEWLVEVRASDLAENIM